MSRIAVTGAKGFVGSHLVKHGVIPLNCDITNEEELKEEILRVYPTAIIHCAAKTNVSWCEENPLEAFKVNVRGTHNIVNVLEDHVPDCFLLYVSSVHVFPGRHWHSYFEYHDPRPVNVYGMTKLMGEEVVSMRGIGKAASVRISKVFSDETLDYILEMPDRVKATGEKIGLSSRLKRSYVFIDDLVSILVGLSRQPTRFGFSKVVHVPGTDLSDYDFHRLVLTYAGIDPDEVIYKFDHELTDVAPRPIRGLLGSSYLSKMGFYVRDVSTILEGRFGSVNVL